MRASVQTHAKLPLLLEWLDRWRDLARKGACDPVKKAAFQTDLAEGRGGSYFPTFSDFRDFLDFPDFLDLFSLPFSRILF
jgi:hypothetical protein